MKKLLLSALLVTAGATQAIDNLIHLSSSNTFPTYINNNNYKGVVVDFYATWCGPCQRLAPYLEELAKQNPTVLFVKVESAFNSIHSQYGIRSYPTIKIFKNGSVIKTIVGFDKTTIKNAVANL